MPSLTPRFHRRVPTPRFYAWAFVLTLFGVRVMTAGQGSATIQPVAAPPVAGACEVVAVIAGDKLLVRQAHLQQPVYVRLLSTQADAADLHATRFTSEFVAGGDVRLKFDNHRLTHHGEYLAYVEVAGVTLNAALLNAGLAKFVKYPGNSGSMDRRLRDAQETAKRREIGIWSK